MNDPLVGKNFDGRYEIIQRVGEGGMGVVYKARQTSIDRVIALKMLNQQMAADPQWVQRFYNEAKACSRLQHPNTIRMFDFGQTQAGQLFMTMEFLDGMSLRQALSGGGMAPNRVMKVLIQCCASLAEAHSIGIIHRDIKPDNVFLLNMAGSPDFVKLLDFSVAKLLEGDRLKTQAGVVFGTPQYMSPEQGRGLPLDARSDLYALGVLAFEMLTGNVPYNDDNPMTVIQMHLHGNVPAMPDSIPYNVQQVVRRAMEKDPNRRYQSAGEMMQHCQQVFAEVSGGGMSIGAGGMPKTMIAGSPGQMQQPMQQQPMLQQPMQQQPMQQQPQQAPPGSPSAHYQAAAPAAKTIVAQVSPFAAGQPAQQAQSGLAAFQQQSGPQQKTVVAGMPAPQLMNQMGMQPGQMPPAGNGSMLGQSPMGTPPGGAMPDGPQKTMMLQGSEGVVSMAQRGGAPIAPATGPVAAVGARSEPTGVVVQGASTLFWIMSILFGIGIGTAAYFIAIRL